MQFPANHPFLPPLCVPLATLPVASRSKSSSAQEAARSTIQPRGFDTPDDLQQEHNQLPSIHHLNLLLPAEASPSCQSYNLEKSYKNVQLFLKTFQL